MRRTGQNAVAAFMEKTAVLTQPRRISPIFDAQLDATKAQQITLTVCIASGAAAFVS